MSKKRKEEALKKLDQAKAEYELIIKQLQDTYDKLFNIKDLSFVKVESTISLIENISNKPLLWDIKKVIKKINAEKKEFLTSEKVRRNEKIKNIVAVSAVVAGLGISAIATISFKEYLTDTFNLKGKKFGKYAIVWLIVAILILVFLIIFLVWKLINRLSATRAAINTTKKVYQEISRTNIEIAVTNSQIEKLTKQSNIVEYNLNEVESFRRKDYRTFIDEDKTKLGILVNNALSLIELLNKE